MNLTPKKFNRFNLVYLFFNLKFRGNFTQKDENIETYPLIS